MTINAKKILIPALLSLISLNSYGFESQEYCDFSRFESKGVNIQFSPLSMSNKLIARERFRDRTIYPHFTYGYSADDPVKEKSLVHRDAVVDTSQFYRVNEGSDKNPKWVRYYTTTIEDCSRIYLRLGEDSEEFQSYWSDRGSIKVTMDEFLEIHSHDLGILNLNEIESMKVFEGDYVTLTPIRGDRKWFNQLSETEYLEFDPTPKQKVKIKRIMKKPFIYRGIKMSSFAIETVLENGSTMLIPGYSHGIIEQNSHHSKEVKKGVETDVLIANRGIPDKILMLPVFKTDSGRILIEDEVLKERVTGGSGINVSEVREGSYIGFVERYEYVNNGKGFSDRYLFDLNGKLDVIDTKTL